MSAPVAVAVVGVTGYEGANVARLLANHPHFRLIEVVSRSAVGQRLGEALPALATDSIANLTITEAVRDAELVILAIPHGPAAELAARYRRDGRRVIDVSADFRLRDPATYATWYGHDHPAPQLLPEAVYGLPEWRREEIQGAQLVANPGCFPTAALLALLPALASDLILPDVIVDAKTGVSGAGRSPSRRVHYVETAESVTAYGVAGHRHLPEMEQEAAVYTASTEAPRITFIPHLVPMNRGILATCYATLRQDVTADAITTAYHDRYRHTPFVQLSEQPPETSWVRGSNRCLIALRVDATRHRLVVISALDNLMKGGAGQAIQNANVMYGFPETAGLPLDGVWP